jgi:hypothetical protein
VQHILVRRNDDRWREVIFLGLGWMVRNRKQNEAAAWLRFLVEKPGRPAEEQPSGAQDAVVFEEAGKPYRCDLVFCASLQCLAGMRSYHSQ